MLEQAADVDPAADAQQRGDRTEQQDGGQGDLPPRTFSLAIRTGMTAEDRPGTRESTRVRVSLIPVKGASAAIRLRVWSMLTGPAACWRSSAREARAPATAHRAAKPRKPGMNQSTTDTLVPIASAGASTRSAAMATVTPPAAMALICTNATSPMPSTLPASSCQACTLASSTSTMRLDFSSRTPWAMPWPNMKVRKNRAITPIAAVIVRSVVRSASGSSADTVSGCTARARAMAGSVSPPSRSRSVVCAVRWASYSGPASGSGSFSRTRTRPSPTSAASAFSARTAASASASFS
ncbi:hypothetical protein SF23_14650 [Streptomyces sp. MBRL 10]|nr:hypothetical protein SF23_14650 [Streptomyces sp. MBRL 10]